MIFSAFKRVSYERLKALYAMTESDALQRFLADITKDRGASDDLRTALGELIDRRTTPVGTIQYPAGGGHDAWWTIHSSVIQEVLQRAHAGEDPEVLYVELIANTEADR